MEITQKTLPEQPYIYVDRQCPYGPQIAEAMGSGFSEVFGFVAQSGITPHSMPMSVYVEMDKDILRFRAAVAVSHEDAARASGTIKSDVLPAGETMTATHVGAYDTMNLSHGAIWKRIEENGATATMPVWEIYVDDPGEVAEADLRTEIYHAIST